MKALRFLKYFRYFLPNVLANLRLRCQVRRVPPFFPLVVTSRLRLLSSRTARIDAAPGSYLRLGYGSGGIAAFEHTGIHLEMQDHTVLKLRGISLVGFGCSLCLYPNSTLEIGDGTYLAGNTVVKCTNSVRIGAGCAISWNVTILDSDFHPWSIDGRTVEISKPVEIGDHVWIGNGVTILKGVSIGTGSIVGAGSIVTRDVPPNSLVVGNPAKVVRERVTW